MQIGFWFPRYFFLYRNSLDCTSGLSESAVAESRRKSKTIKESLQKYPEIQCQIWDGAIAELKSWLVPSCPVWDSNELQVYFLAVVAWDFDRRLTMTLKFMCLGRKYRTTKAGHHGTKHFFDALKDNSKINSKATLRSTVIYHCLHGVIFK